ncbi:LLM class flavin-dependent oxidoreductase [Streptomyces sp. NPDC002156]
MSVSMPALSVLDHVLIRADQTSSAAIAATTSLARAADGFGYRRYWIGEHHNVASLVSTNPSVLLGLVAAATERIRVGSGGIMLPNYGPLAVAENFALLEAAFPGRADLGIGRAPGGDGVTAHLLRGGRSDDGDHYPGHVEQLAAMMTKDGLDLDISRAGRTSAYNLKAIPGATSEPDLWLLGSGTYSAELAARQGRPFAFAHHFAGHGTEQALATYRSGFRPSRQLAEPKAIIVVNAVVADTRQEAEFLALAQLHILARFETGQPFERQYLAEEAAELPITDSQRPVIDALRETFVLGDAATAAEQVRTLADRFHVDEIMIHPVPSARRGGPARRSPTRERTLELLARELL